jgi:hypothetical protein
MNHDETLRQRAGISQRAVVARILKVWAAADDTVREDGAQWYLTNGREIEQIAQDSGVRRETAAAVVAHLSPRMRWERNLLGAAELCNHDNVLPGFMGREVAGARSAMAAEYPLDTLRGPKTSAFARNLLGDEEAVTVDVWAVRVALGGDREDLDRVLNRKGVYDAIAHCYRLAARRAGVTPPTMQATTWLMVARNGYKS